MAATLASVCSVPLTSVLLLFELTKDYRILLPLMVICFSNMYIHGGGLLLDRSFIHTILQWNIVQLLFVALHIFVYRTGSNGIFLADVTKSCAYLLPFGYVSANILSCGRGFYVRKLIVVSPKKNHFHQN